MNKTLLLFLLVITQSFACELPQGKELRIACVEECGYSVEMSLLNVAKELNYNVRLERLNYGVINPITAYDGFIIPGGADISPAYYNRNLPPELSELIKSLDYLVDYSEEGKRRDPVEFHFVKRYSSDNSYKNTPLLGICRGLQMMAVGSDIPLYVDLKTELNIPNRINLFDQINFLDKNTEIAKMFNGLSFLGYKYHHQAIRYDYFNKSLKDQSNVRIIASSNNNKIPEIILFKNRPAMGIQFHPEFTSEKRVNENFFRWLLIKSCQKAKL